MATLSAIRDLMRPVMDFALPPRCPACGVIVPDDDRFCLDCWSGLHFLGEPCCARCGFPFAHDMGADALCGGCMAASSPLDRARAVLVYGEAAKAIALRLKYGRRVGLARLMAAQMARHLPAADRADMLIVPVPLHRWRLWSRGFNQSALIADRLGRFAGLPVEKEALVRKRRTPPLRGMGPRARARTVKGAFGIAAARPDFARDRIVILIDDVHTTGATAEACARVLRRAGARAVHLLCWARVLPDAQGPVD
jgi:ComF family protein